jgi:hypothetical protein
MKKYLTFPLVLVACCTIGLAPFTPEPHVWEKLKRIVNDANGMSALDWFDLVLHGLPWLLLLILIYKQIIKK